MGGRGEIKMASAGTQSANEPDKDLILVHTVQLKPIINAQISGRMVSSGISDNSVRFSILEEVDYDNYYYYEKIARIDGF